MEGLFVILDAESCQALVDSERWLSKVQEADNGCLLWIADVVGNGYGRVSLGGRRVYVHRVALTAVLGRNLGEGMQVGHLCHDLAFEAGECEGGVCDHRRCVNPNHLAEQSPRDNTLAGNTPAAANSVKEYCPRGHELAGDNLVPSQLPDRVCLVCARGHTRRLNRVISEAYKTLGLTRSEYLRVHGGSRVVAEEIVRSRV